MAWAIFAERFHYDRRPRQAIAFVVEASPDPQNRPRDLVNAAVAAGKARETKPPGRRPKTTETKSNGRQ
ncbi:hypothetical protein EN868_03095 [Mesorhizobium sp. M2D.F.Ca.ET.225.01.1.1]|nr:hypothetical protein EN869_003100 [Mesorhizobium sp. M2D.F.Ca.ET.226.01.1.1]TGP71929.1 hypothetical protein EN868_03095 [Mesorhizobium sp. M2D.F.Ca.ET.225.01.1.1]